MKKKFAYIIKFLIFLSISLFLFWYVYRGLDMSELFFTLKNEVDYFWIILSLFFGLLSHISRTIRWNMLIKSLGQEPRMANTFLAVMVGYFANLALPRMGEISRCGVISKYEGVSFSKLVGTVALERALDIAMLIVFLVIALSTQFSVIENFFARYPEVSQNIKQVLTSVNTLYVLTVLAILVWILRKKLKNSIVSQRINKTLANFASGFKTVKSLENKWSFILHTVFIWLMYYLMIYICFFSFVFTSKLPALAGLTVFVMGSFGMVAPVQGGIGAWHSMVIGILSVYLSGVANVESLSKSFALVVHGAQTVMIIIVGALSVIALPIVNRKQRTKIKLKDGQPV